MNIIWFLCRLVVLLWAVVMSSANARLTCAQYNMLAEGVSKYLTFSAPALNLNQEPHGNCTWTIKARTIYKQVYAEVVSSSLQPRSSTFCGDESVIVYDGSSTEDRQILTWCGAETPVIQSTGVYLTLHYISHNSTASTGFEVRYRQVSGSCGGEYTATSTYQYLTSPNYPRKDYNNKTCIWTITTRKPLINLNVTDSDLDNSPDCTIDSVRVYDGVSEKLLGSFCGNQTPSFRSDSRLVKIEFVTNSMDQYKGFKMKYSAGYPDTHVSDLGAILGGTFAAIVFIGVAIYVILFGVVRRMDRKTRRRHRNRARARARRPPGPATSQQQVTFTVPGAPDTFAGPPSYEEVMANDEIYRGAAEAPPPYSSLGVVSDGGG